MKAHKINTALSKEKWYVEHIEARPLFVSSSARGFVQSKAYDVMDYSAICSRFSKGQADWCSLCKEQTEAFLQIMSLQRKDSSYWKQKFLFYLQERRKYRAFYLKEMKNNLTLLSLDALFSELARCIELHWHMRNLSSICDMFMFAAEERLSHLVKDTSLFSILPAPEHISIMAQEEMDLFLIAQRHKKALASEKSIRQLKKHIEKYAWIRSSSFHRHIPYTIEDALSKAKELILHPPHLATVQKIRQKRRQCIKQNNVNGELAALSDLTIFFSHWQDLRKETMLQATTIHDRLVMEIGRRINMDPDLISYLDYSELGDFRKGRISAATLLSRRDGCLFVYKNSNVSIFLEQEVKGFVDAVLGYQPVASDNLILKGIPASLGSVSGFAYIAKNMDQMRSIPKGAILVAPMTRPEHTPFLSKISGLITDEGGITCHAAIVSRELSIPCIIGTKIATKALKSGDYVEIDAEKGVVRKMKL